MAKAPVKRRYNFDTNQWEVVKPRTGPTPASNTRKKMRLAAAAAEAEKKKTAPKPAAKKKKTTASSYSGPYGANASVDSAQPKGPKGRGGKRGMSPELARRVKLREQQTESIANAVATNTARPKGPKGRGGKRATGLYLGQHPGASSYDPKKKKLKSSLGIAIGGYSLR